MSDELKPCPFCNAVGSDLDPTMARNTDGEVAAGCYVCGATGPIRVSEKAATEAWNLRTTETD